MKPLMALRTCTHGIRNQLSSFSNYQQIIEEAILQRGYYHGILPHKYNALKIRIIGSQAPPDLVHLLRADIVHGDNENGFILFQQAFELVEVASFVASLAPHIFLEMKIGYLRGKSLIKFGIWSCSSKGYLCTNFSRADIFVGLACA